jgi:hypothetical protein
MLLVCPWQSLIPYPCVFVENEMRTNVSGCDDTNLLFFFGFFGPTTRASFAIALGSSCTNERANAHTRLFS